MARTTPPKLTASQRARVKRILRHALSDDEKRVAIMRWRDGLTDAEIAAVMGVASARVVELAESILRRRQVAIDASQKRRRKGAKR